jgi:type I restriction enzyme M protein
MDHSVHNKLVSFIWSIADDCLRDVYVRGKYRDVILPMVVLRLWTLTAVACPR